MLIDDKECSEEKLSSCCTPSTSSESKLIAKEEHEFLIEELAKMNGNAEVSDAELKVLLGRLVDKAKDGNEIKSTLSTQINSTDDRRWQIMTQHLCMERIQRVERLSAQQRASYKLAHYFGFIDSALVAIAFKQLLENCCANFEGSFDALFQRVATVIDFGRSLESDPTLVDAECFFKILQIQESTADNNTFRLAFRFAQFLAKLSGIGNDKEAFEINDPIQDDIVARLFNDVLVTKQSDDDDKDFELPLDELADYCKRRLPETVKRFMEMLNSKEDPIDVLVAFECFEEFALRNQSAVRAQSHQLIDLLMKLENKFNIGNFVPKINKCVVHVLAADLTTVPSFCQRLTQVYGSMKKMQIVNCIDALINHSIDNQTTNSSSLQKSKPKPQQTKEIGRVIRKSVALTNKSSEKQVTTKPMINIVDKILKPFISTVLTINLVEKSEPVTINGILSLLYNFQQRGMLEFRHILDEYFLFLQQVRVLNDWSTRLKCAQCYAGLALMASAPGEDRQEWSMHFEGVDEWLGKLVQQAITQSDRQQHVQLDEFQRQLCAFFGNLQI